MCQIPPPYQILNTHHDSLAALLPLRNENAKSEVSTLKAHLLPVDYHKENTKTDFVFLFSGLESGGRRDSNDFATNRTTQNFWLRYFNCQLSLVIRGK